MSKQVQDYIPEIGTILVVTSMKVLIKISNGTSYIYYSQTLKYI